jgi:citrate lyase subunit beta / citryl-CoA lyase
MPVLHPDCVLFQDAGQDTVGTSCCEHYAGDEKKLRKAFALQAELGGAFDVTADLEDGAAAGEEETIARLVAGILAKPRPPDHPAGCRVHPVDHPAFRRDIELLLAARPAQLAYITIPKVTGSAQLNQAVQTMESVEQQAGFAARLPPSDSRGERGRDL